MEKMFRTVGGFLPADSLQLQERPSVRSCAEFSLEIRSAVSSFTAFPPSWEVLRRFVDLCRLRIVAQDTVCVGAALVEKLLHLRGQNARAEPRIFDRERHRGIWKFRNVHLRNANAMQQNQVFTCAVSNIETLDFQKTRTVLKRTSFIFSFSICETRV